MSTPDLLALLPLLLIAASAVVVMLGIAFKRDPALAAGLTARGLDGRVRLHLGSRSRRPATSNVPPARGSICPVLHGSDHRLGRRSGGAFLSIFRSHEGQREELYLLLLLATLGCAVLVASSHFVSFFLDWKS
jgi:NADH-quinone oxidoreductase subunit N